jgi:hypothetical protein
MSATTPSPCTYKPQLLARPLRRRMHPHPERHLGSRRPRMTTKSYTLPLWKKKPHSPGPTTSDSEHIVFKVPMPRYVVLQHPKPGTRISRENSFTSKHRSPSRDAHPQRPPPLLPRHPRTPHACLQPPLAPPPKTATALPPPLPKRPYNDPPKSMLHRLLPHHRRMPQIRLSLARKVLARGSSQTREQPGTVPFENPPSQVRLGRLELLQLVFPQRAEPRRRFGARDHGRRGRQTTPIDRRDRD